MIPEFVWLALFAASFYGLLFYVDRRWGRRLLNREFSERERVLAASIMKSEQSFSRLETTVDLLKSQLDAKDQRILELTREIQRLELKVADLTHQLQEHKVIEQTPPVSILALWPSPPGQPALDQEGESDALYNAGFAYTALRGARCNRAGVILEIDRVRPTIIQVGSHGNSSGILLSDGYAEPGWWGEVVAGKSIQLMVLLSCDSSQQDEINVSDALVRAGVRAVISCDEQIGDADAVKFAELLYAKLAEGLPLLTATRRAKLALSRKASEMIRLREREGER